MENKVSKTKVAKGGKGSKAKKISKKVIESDVSDSLSEASNSVSPVEVEPKVKVTKKTAKATKVKKVDKSDCPVECCVEDEVKKTKDCEAECCEEEKPQKKSKAKKAKDPNAPKKELNPIMKEMNKFRNEVIGPVVGSKAPKLTIPPFKLAMAAARSEMGLGEKDKNTVETVQKAVELFQSDNSKYLEN